MRKIFSTFQPKTAFLIQNKKRTFSFENKVAFNFNICIKVTSTKEKYNLQNYKERLQRKSSIEPFLKVNYFLLFEAVFTTISVLSKCFSFSHIFIKFQISNFLSPSKSRSIEYANIIKFQIISC